ncbi:MAG: DUF58 domain-containing protein [Sandaracinaceae bacterium]
MPGRRLAVAATAGLPLAALDGGTGLGLGTALAFDAVLLVGAALESRRLDRQPVAARRRMERRLVVGVPNVIAVELHNPYERPVSVTVRDDLPAGWVAEPKELSVELPAHARRTLEYRVTPPSRGRFAFGDLHVKMESRAGLGARLLRYDANDQARVFPNILGPRRYELAARLGELASVGVRSIRRTGGGGEFEQLREYVAGDAFRDLDWKSTAKRQRPITRVFEQEKSQIVLLAIDAGRMMATRLGAISKLDHAINAALLLAWVALRKGDRVGLIVFADQVQAFVPPARGPGQYRALLEALFATEAEETSVDFRRLVEFVQVRARKRALMVIFSDLLDETHARPLAKYAAVLRKKHLPLCVTMHDPVAESMADAHVEDARTAYQRAAAADLLAEREGVKAHLRKSGVRLVEAPPGELAIATVNRYLEVKARRSL